MRCSWTALTMFLGTIAVSSPAMAQQSATFTMDRISATAVGDTASSSTFTTTVVLGQDSPSGATSVCNTGFANSLGFWSVLGDLPVPIFLLLGKDATNPNVLEMSWSGAADLFQVFRSSSPIGVANPLNLVDETGDCELQRSDTWNSSFYMIAAAPDAGAAGGMARAADSVEEVSE